MGQILHGSATTTEAVRRAIQNSQASLRELAGRYGINQKTVAKWRRRASACDAAMGPKAPHSTVLSKEEEALVVAFRKHTLLPLDDCLSLSETLYGWRVGANRVMLMPDGRCSRAAVVCAHSLVSLESAT